MTKLTYFVVVVLWTSIQMAISMNTHKYCSKNPHEIFDKEEMDLEYLLLGPQTATHSHVSDMKSQGDFTRSPLQKGRNGKAAITDSHQQEYRLQHAFNPIYPTFSGDIHPTSEKITGGIDIQNFHSHIPDKMCSAAAIHFTHDLIKTVSAKYKHHPKSLNHPTWEVAKYVWTSDTLNPFVYFVLACNPTMKVWKFIKSLTAFIFKTYHKWSVKRDTISNQEKLTRFVLWYTEVIYQILKLGPQSKPSQESHMKKVMDVPSLRLSTLASMFYMVHADCDSFVINASTGLISEQNLVETFERDFELGYPTRRICQNGDLSVWEKWKIKSEEIKTAAEDVRWPEFFDPPRSESEPILFVNEEIENDLRLNEDPQVSKFIHHWKMDFMETVRFIKNSQSEKTGFYPHTLKDFSQGIHLFLKENLPGSSNFAVTLFSEFLHQDSHDEVFADFWEVFRFKIRECPGFRCLKRKRQARVEHIN
ncbi:hypothetical protein DFH28DRAFT_952076 [Melampsora americana]|nr:hypothetical protein DFH28DRAFT_952076 [Melampsora americana]